VTASYSAPQGRPGTQLERELRAQNLAYGVQRNWIALEDAVLWALQGYPPPAWAAKRTAEGWART
jgi:hypothetical protein